MTGKGHFQTGIAFSISAFLFSKDLGGLHWISAIFCIIGVNSPDYLEIRRGGSTLIPHRTITHWIPLWLIIFFYSVFSLNSNYFDFFSYLHFPQLDTLEASALLGFSIGGLLHLLFDLPNPMGVPLIAPWKRVSLNLWNSGNRENLIIFTVWIFTILYITFYNNLFDYFIQLI